MTLVIKNLFTESPNKVSSNYYVLAPSDKAENQAQVEESYSIQWKKADQGEDKLKSFEWQKRWYLELYGFGTEEALKSFLAHKSIILDAGCGLGYKAAWFSELAPHATVIGMDISEGCEIGSQHFSGRPNLIFVRGDIARTQLNASVIDFISCDQVLQHTESPIDTLREFRRIIAKTGELAVYVYRKKALPRELIDSYFRESTLNISYEDKLMLSRQLTELGRTLSNLNITIDVPDIPLLGIKGGRQDLQRFFYWNFLKCFWNKDLGEHTSILTNFDWYSPSNAARYSKNEFLSMLIETSFEMKELHEEEACYSGRAIPT